MTIYFLGCAFAGFIIGIIVMYFITRVLIGQLAFEFYFVAKAYISVSQSIPVKNDHDKLSIEKFLDEIETKTYQVKKHIPEKYNDAVRLVDLMAKNRKEKE